MSLSASTTPKSAKSPTHCQIWISHITHINEACRTHEWVMSHSAMTSRKSATSPTRTTRRANVKYFYTLTFTIECLENNDTIYVLSFFFLSFFFPSSFFLCVDPRLSASNVSKTTTLCTNILFFLFVFFPFLFAASDICYRMPRK